MITRSLILDQWMIIITTMAHELGFKGTKLIDLEAIEAMANLFNKNNFQSYFIALSGLIDIYNRNKLFEPIRTDLLIRAAFLWSPLVNARLVNRMWVPDPMDVDLYWLQFRRLGKNITIFNRYPVCLFVCRKQDNLNIFPAPQMYGRRKLNFNSPSYWGQWIEIQTNFYGQIWTVDKQKNKFVLRTPRGLSYYPQRNICTIVSRRQILRWLVEIKEEVILD